MSSFRTVAAQHNYPEREEEVLNFWKEIDAFQTSMRISKEENRPEFTFYDGPPFATGLPHYGHILAGTIKDVVTRFAYQTGFHVSRRFGWDTHGLPVEHEIDKKLNIKSKQDVMDMGIAAYNKECRSIVTRYCSEWEHIVTRLGRWIDFENDYKTLEPWYMESVWWVFKTIYEKNLVYRGFRVMPYSTGCTTPLSNFEANLNYKEVSDPAVVVSFPLVDEPETAFLAWTTTPWTLPSNLALCVHPESKYVKVKDNASGRQYILMEARLVQVYPKMAKKGYKNDEFVVLESYTGAELKGKRYEPLFPYFKDHPNAFQVLNDTYVTEDGGTGVVHQAPAFGEDDHRVCEEHGVLVKGGDIPCPVDENGCFDENVPDFVGLYVKDADNKICEKLKAAGRLINKGSIKHSYPFCWRSDTPLIYKIVPSWFVRVTDIKDRLVANNLETDWVPQNVKEKRFHNWLVNARDWNVSRNRYWGTPIPVWVSDDGEERVVIGSIEELETLSGMNISDLHRESIDHITIPSKEGRGDLKRIEEVFDCWFESGSMPYAQQHYPFENREKFEQELFPADFIAEGLDQTRGWFYTLMVLSTALFDRPAFKNLIVNGLVLAEDGKKMSKSKKNYPDPMIVINEFGSDAIRLYLINSPVVRAEPLKFRQSGVADVRKNVFNPWYNAYRFFVQNAQRLELDTNTTFDKSSAEALAKSSTNVMDRWIMAALHRLIQFVRGEMSAYRLYTVVPELLRFGEQLTNWYVRLNRQRLKGAAAGQTTQDVHVALSTLYVVLLNLTKLMAPVTPFFTEFMYQELVQPDHNSKEASVHFCQIPQFDPEMINKDIEVTMAHLQTAITLGRLCRERRNISMKKPVREITVVTRDPEMVEKLKTLEGYLKVELNTHKISWTTDQEKWCNLAAKLIMQVNFKKLDISDDEKDQWQSRCRELGSRLGRDVGKVRKAMEKLTPAQLLEFENSKTINVEGHELTDKDIQLQRTPKEDLGKHLELGSSDGMTLVLDTTVDNSLIQEGLVREVLNRIQKLRKAAGLEFQDTVEFFYEIIPEVVHDPFNSAGTTGEGKPGDRAKFLEESIVSGKKMITETLRGGVLFPVAKLPEFGVKVADANDTVNGVTLRLVLTRPSPSFAPIEVLTKDFGVDEVTAQGLKVSVGSMSYQALVESVSTGTPIKISVSGKAPASYELVPNKHFFTSVQE